MRAPHQSSGGGSVPFDVAAEKLATMKLVCIAVEEGITPEDVLRLMAERNPELSPGHVGCLGRPW